MAESRVNGERQILRPLRKGWSWRFVGYSNVFYVDESGSTGNLPATNSDIQPLFTILGLIIDQSRIHDFSLKFIYLKRQFFLDAVLWDKRPPQQFLDWVLFEPKGSDLRKSIAEGRKRIRRHAHQFVDKTLSLIEEAEAKLIGRVWIKGVGVPFDGHSVYTASIQHLCRYFDNYLTRQNQYGLMIADNRTKDKNAKVSHSVFTQRFSSSGNPYSRLLELPVFGQSENHVGIQVCDLICSGIVFPIAVQTYCVGHVQSVHVRPGYEKIKEEFAERIKNLQHRFLSSDGKWRGGIVCSDGIAQRPGKLFFEL